MRNGSLCIGVVDYEQPAYGTSSSRLEFAVTDAEAFSRYFAAASEPTAPAGHKLLLNRAARLVNIREAVTQIAAEGPYELFVVYLAGHGEKGDERGGWFCLADAEPGRRSLDGAAIESFLRAIEAKSILVVVDCCHAEAVIGGLTFFSSLGAQIARLFVASARRDQLAWEDADLRRSVLSDVFLRACSRASALANARGTVNVEAALFPHLREQIPLLAAAQKNGIVQEPVTGGMARADVELPVVDSRSFGRSLTVAQTVRLRLRQVLTKGAIACLVFVAGVQVLLYHVAVDATGRVLVRSGLESTRSLIPEALAGEVDSGIRLEDFATSDSTGLNSVAQSGVWGFRSHLDERGARPWLKQLAPLLRQPNRVRNLALAFGEVPGRKLPDDSVPPLDSVRFLSSFLSQRSSKVAAALYPPLDMQDIECGSSRARKLDFTLLNVGNDAYARDLSWHALLAADDPQTAGAEIVRQVKATSYRASFLDEEAALADVAPFVLSVAQLVRTGRMAETQNALESLLDTACKAHAAVALRLFAASTAHGKAEALLLKELQTFDRAKQGDLPSKEQVLAARALAAMAEGLPLLSSTVESLVTGLRKTDSHLERPTLERSVLREVAVVQPLPSDFVKHLFEVLESPPQQHDFGYLAALELLSRNLHHLDVQSASRLGKWVHTNAAKNSTMSDMHSALGFVLAADPVVQQALINLLGERLSPATYFPVPTTGYRGELAIYSRGDEAAVALGRVIHKRELRNGLEERLVRIAIGHQELPDRNVIVDGLAKRWYPAPPEASAVHHRLAAATGDARKRLLEVEVACAALTLEEPIPRSATLSKLLDLWRLESEPELRIAIALVIARSRSIRYGRTSACGRD